MSDETKDTTKITPETTVIRPKGRNKKKKLLGLPEKKAAPLNYVDAGANLAHPQFREDFQKVIDYSFEQGIQHIVVITNDLKHAHRNVNMALDAWDKLRCTIGMHPHHAKYWDSKQHIPLMRGLIRKRSQVIKAIGETGLDYNRLISSQETQLACFDAQVRLACEEKYPLYVHERDAHHDLMDVFQKYRDKLPRVFIHCFTGTEKQLNAYLALGFSIGITGYITKPEGEHIQSILHKIPLDKIMVESNAPFLIPDCKNSFQLLEDPKRNEPATLPIIVETVRNSINAKRSPEEQLSKAKFSEILWKNSKAFFSL